MPFTARALEEKQAHFGLVECVNHDLLQPYHVLHDKLGIATVHPKCQTRPCPSNEDNPPDSRTGDPKLLGAKCKMTPKFSNEDTR
ncbi:hypothetical protein AgCh_013207 [Apium graveolens]